MAILAHVAPIRVIPELPVPRALVHPQIGESKQPGGDDRPDLGAVLGLVQGLARISRPGCPMERRALAGSLGLELPHRN